MGRVRKYKKIKAVDPFSKRRAVKDDSKYDLPPDESSEYAFPCLPPQLTYPREAEEARERTVLG